MPDYYVAVDPEGYYFDPQTEEPISVVFDDNGRPFDAELGVPLQFWGDSGFDGAQITSAVRDVLIAVYGNPAAVRANAPRDRVPIMQAPAATREVIVSDPRASRSDGAGIHLSTTTLMLIVGGVLLFMVGQNRGASRR